MQTEDLDYFKREKEIQNPIFFFRFPNLTFYNLKVLDLGCGHGALSIDIAEKGAAKVIGIDLDKKRIDFANANLKINYEHFANKVSFIATDLKKHDKRNYDIIISKASFEHIIDLDDLMLEIKNKLKIGGRLITGFGPLYSSPWGDHRRLKHNFPWSHVILTQKYFINKLNKARTDKIESIYDLGLNGLLLKQYKKLFFNTKGFKVIDFRTNVTHKLSGKLFNIFTYIPGFKEFFTFNVYCILERVDYQKPQERCFKL